MPETPLASVPCRATAYVLDVGIAFVALLALQAVLYPVNPLLQSDDSAGGMMLHGWVTLTVTVPVAIFFAVSWASPAGATPGMRLLHIRVRGVSGESVPMWRALVRAVVLLVPFEVNHAVLFYPEPMWDMPSPGYRSGFIVVYALMLIYLAVTLWTPKRQGPHDLAAGTIVSAPVS
ncbi:MAG: RDD family protein, partial [Gemmatimonadaceae bacterium]